MMEHEKIIKIKKAVKGNFDESPMHYQSFEDRHSFFRTLNAKLLDGMNIPGACDILDIGCGTGASTLQILESLPRCRVWGLDNSAQMLKAACSRYGELNGICFVEGDAAKLTDYFDFKFDVIIYSASIFLIPDFRASLEQARCLMKNRGTLGLTFMDGVYDDSGDLAFQLADKTAKSGVSLKKPVNLPDFCDYFGKLFPMNRKWNEDFRLTTAGLMEFFSIPAMSAGLYPGIAYQERLEKLQTLFRCMPSAQALFRWCFMVGEISG